MTSVTPPPYAANEQQRQKPQQQPSHQQPSHQQQPQPQASQLLQQQPPRRQSPPRSFAPLNHHSQIMSPSTKRDLKSWWRQFKLPTKNQETNEPRPRGIFGVPLRQSITYAHVAISLVDDETGQSYIYGYVPIVVAKCGVFLKEKATGVEGIFRLSGSEKRIKELKTLFDSPPRYGKGLVWDQYTVHDAANVLRRYLNDLPQPVVPLDLYEKFREPLRGATKQPLAENETPFLRDSFDMADAIAQYKRLITELPPLNRQLLLYLLDLLAVFAAKSDENRMNSQNLAAIFQPGMLSHPSHAMAPEEYRLNQCVVIFLIENQDNFLIGMQGTATDAKMVQEVENQQQSPARAALSSTMAADTKKSSVVRTASTASAGAESVKRDGKIRRHKSTSSKRSRQSNGATSSIESPSLTGAASGGLSRSNTVPSKKSPGMRSGRFQCTTTDGSSVATPRSPLSPMAPSGAPPSESVETGSTPGMTTPAGPSTPLRGPISDANSPSHLPNLAVPSPSERASEATTPNRIRTLPSLFQQRSPTDDSADKRPPNKLRKKKPDGANVSAHSSTVSLSPPPPLPIAVATPAPVVAVVVAAASASTPTLAVAARASSSSHVEASRSPPLSSTLPLADKTLDQLPAPAEVLEESLSMETMISTLAPEAPANDMAEKFIPIRNTSQPNSSTLHPGSAEDILAPKKSLSTSLHGSFSEGSDLDHVDEALAAAVTTVLPAEQAEKDKEKKRKWRISKRKEDYAASLPQGLASPRLLGINRSAELSASSIGSAAAHGKTQRSMTSESVDGVATTNIEGALSQNQNEGAVAGRDHGEVKDDSQERGLTSWLKTKYREAKEIRGDKRTKSPPADNGHRFGRRGKSLDLGRSARSDDEKSQSAKTSNAVPR